MFRLAAIATLLLLITASSFASVENYEGGKDDFIPFLDTVFNSGQRSAKASSVPMKALFFVSSLIDFAADMKNNPRKLPDVRGVVPAYRASLGKLYPGTKVKILGLEKEDGGAGIRTLVIFPEKCAAKPSQFIEARLLMSKLSTPQGIKILFPSKTFGRVHMEHISDPHWVNADGTSLSASSKPVKSLKRALMFGAAIFDHPPKWFNKKRRAVFRKVIRQRVPGARVSMRVTVDDGFDKNNRFKAIANILVEARGKEKEMQKLRRTVEYAANTIWKRKRWGRVHVEGGVRLGWTGASCHAPINRNGCCRASFKITIPNMLPRKFNRDPAGCNNCIGSMKKIIEDKLMDPRKRDALPSVNIFPTSGPEPGSTDVIVDITVKPDNSEKLVPLVQDLDDDPRLIFTPEQWGDIIVEPPSTTPQCEIGEIKCNPSSIWPYADCINPLGDDDHCGSCGSKCTGGDHCVGGECIPPIDPKRFFECPIEQTHCEDGCFNLLTSDIHCGTCLQQCKSGQVCSGGECVPACADLETRCRSISGYYCINTLWNKQNCGACGNRCAANETCSFGKCVANCASGQTRCTTSTSYICANLLNNGANCGACGRPCSQGQYCQNGRCLSPPPPSLTPTPTPTPILPPKDSCGGCAFNEICIDKTCVTAGSDCTGKGICEVCGSGGRTCQFNRSNSVAGTQIVCSNGISQYRDTCGCIGHRLQGSCPVSKICMSGVARINVCIPEFLVSNYSGR
jgi:hypothetical protein